MDYWIVAQDTVPDKVVEQTVMWCIVWIEAFARRNSLGAFLSPGLGEDWGFLRSQGPPKPLWKIFSAMPPPALSKPAARLGPWDQDHSSGSLTDRASPATSQHTAHTVIKHRITTSHRLQSGYKSATVPGGPGLGLGCNSPPASWASPHSQHKDCATYRHGSLALALSGSSVSRRLCSLQSVTAQLPHLTP